MVNFTAACGKKRIDDIQSSPRDEEATAAANNSDQLSLVIYPNAGHPISGTGTSPIWLYGEQGDDPWSKVVKAEGRAAADAWQRTLTFLKKM